VTTSGERLSRTFQASVQINRVPRRTQLATVLIIRFSGRCSNEERWWLSATRG